MWRHHADNNSPEAWRDLTASLHKALTFAAEYDVTFGIEPETNNVVDSAKKARRLLDEMKTSRLKIVMDPANLFCAGELKRMREALDEAFESLGQDIVIAHAKDLVEDGSLHHVAAGKGSLDYDHYVAWLRKINFDGAIILHGLAEEEVSGCVDFLRQKLANDS
jgi:sugar phosphate isomerase/epimerase